jgi:hypothetical protein
VTKRNIITIYLQDIVPIQYENTEQDILLIYCSTEVKHMCGAAADKNIIRQLFYIEQKYLSIMRIIVLDSAENSPWEV